MQNQIINDNLQALIVAPTREIALQAQEYIAFLCKDVEDNLVLHKPPLLLIGGLDAKEQKRKILVDKPAIMVGTPGRIKEFLENELISFRDLKAFIIDEADKFCFQT